MAALNQQAEWKLCNAGFDSTAQGRSSPSVGQSQGSQFAFYQLDSQHTELEDSSSLIGFGFSPPSSQSLHYLSPVTLG